jgi:hypothetical protein
MGRGRCWGWLLAAPAAVFGTGWPSRSSQVVPTVTDLNDDREPRPETPAPGALGAAMPRVHALHCFRRSVSPRGRPNPTPPPEQTGSDLAIWLLGRREANPRQELERDHGYSGEQPDERTTGRGGRFGCAAPGGGRRSAAMYDDCLSPDGHGPGNSLMATAPNGGGIEVKQRLVPRASTCWMACRT